MYRPDFATRVEHIVAAKNKLLVGLGSQQEALEAKAIVGEYSDYAKRLQPYDGDTTHLLLDAVVRGDLRTRRQSGERRERRREHRRQPTRSDHEGPACSME